MPIGEGRGTRPQNGASLEQVEEWLRTQRRESGYVFDRSGRMVWQKHTDCFEITIEPKDYDLIHGNVFTHNHPRGWQVSEDDPRRAGDSFSPDDIVNVAIPLELAAIRAVSPYYRFSMRPGLYGWPEATRLADVYRLIDEELRKQMMAGLLAGTMNAREMTQRNADHRHLVWQRLAALFGIVYSREDLPK